MNDTETLRAKFHAYVKLHFHNRSLARDHEGEYVDMYTRCLWIGAMLGAADFNI